MELEEKLKGKAEDVTMAEANVAAETTTKQCEEMVQATAAAQLPILLIQQKNARGERRKGATAGGAGEHMGSGWDVVLPKGWGMPLWVSLIHAGCRVVGLRDVRKLCHEMGSPCFPFDFPDCRAYEEWSKEKRRELEGVYNRKPPGKRVNFSKLSVAYPFSSPWKALISFWSPSHGGRETLSVLRGYSLRLFEESLAQLLYVERGDVIKGLMAETWQVPRGMEEVAGQMVMVRVEMEASGTVEPFSMLSLPDDTHLEALRSFRAGETTAQGCAAMKEADRPPTNHSGDTMWSLAASPSPVPLLGFVTSAGHSYALGKGTALAFCPAAALAALAQSSARYDRSSLLSLPQPSPWLQ